MKKILTPRLIIVTLLFLVLILSGCNNTATKEGGGEFTYASSAGFTHFDPHNYNTTSQGNLYAQVYEALTARNADYVLTEGFGLAKTWSLVSDTQWVFELQKGVKFHDGSQFTAEDVVASWERAAASTEGTISVAKNIISDIEIVDDYEIIISTNAYVPILPAALTSLYIMDKDWIESNNVQETLSSKDEVIKYTATHANGTGTYKLESLTPNEEAVFTKNNKYWNKSRAGSLDTIKYVTIEKDATRIAALISGQVDMIFPVPLQDWDRIEGEESLSLVTGLESRPIFLGLDQHRDTLIGAEDGAKANPFKDKKVREAFNLAIDIDEINKQIMRGKALPIGILSSPGLGGHPIDNDALNAAYPYDLEKAKSLLAEAGYENGFSVVLDAPNNRYINDEAVAQAIVGMLAKVNINATLQTKPRSDYFNLIFNERNTSIYMLGWHPIASHDYDIVTRLLAYPNEEPKLGGFNIGQYNNQKINEIAAKLGESANNDIFDELIEEAYTIAKEDFAYVPLFAPPLSAGIKKEYSFNILPDERVEFSQIKK